MEKEVVLISGPPGCARDEYLSEVIGDKPDIRYFQVFKYMHDIAKETGVHGDLTAINISILSESDVETIKEKAFRRIREEIDDSKKKHHIVSTSCIFYHSDWTKEEGITKELFHLIRPNVTIAFIDDLIAMKKRLMNDSRWRREFTPGPPLLFLSKWRQESIDFLHKMSMSYSKVEPKGFVENFYIFARQHTKGTMLSLISKRDEKLVLYLSYPITDASGLPRVKDFERKLSERFIVFDPYTIKDWDIVKKYDSAKEGSDREIEINGFSISLEEVENAMDSIRAQVVNRDFAIIDSVDAVVVYHQKKQPSVGVTAEITYAKQNKKPVFGCYPFSSRPSPFLEYFIKWGKIPTLYEQEDELIEEIKELEEEIRKLRDRCRITF
jgi:adenylate kinase